MIEFTHYLSNSIQPALEITELSEDEIESIVGRFTKTSSRYGQLRGELVKYFDGKVIIRHHFTKKVLWTNG